MGLDCQHLCKAYPTRKGSIVALNDMTFQVGQGEFVCVVGPSGCGKTTLLKIIAGLLEPTSGQLIYRSLSIEGHPRSALVFQEHGLYPWMTVLDNVAFGLKMQGLGKQERHERAMAFLSRVGLAAFAHNHPHELSTGMSQRVGIARAFVADPQMLLMDEPFGSLDAQTKLVLEEELLGIWREHKQLIVYVTHDIEEAVILGDRVLVMTGRPGRVRADIPIPIERPRDRSRRAQADVAEVKWRIWKMLKEEVRASLGMPS
jgi:ABC-type nitrate/sulfonate/bicarbonate transport system ATPase subunit